MRARMSWARRYFAASVLFVDEILVTPVYAASVLDVGPGKRYATVCAAIADAAAGDTILIRRRRAVPGGQLHPLAGWPHPEGRQWPAKIAGSSTAGPIWVLRGANTTVENIEFTPAAGQIGITLDRRGASLTTIRGSIFKGGRYGFYAVAGPVIEARILVEHSSFPTLRSAHLHLQRGPVLAAILLLTRLGGRSRQEHGSRELCHVQPPQWRRRYYTS